MNRILELGSGTGLLGMVASKLGKPASVVLTDGDGETMNLLQQNLKNPFNAIDEATAKAAILQWGEEQEVFHKWLRRSFPEQNDTKFDLILAGDVMYKNELPKPFFETVCSLLTETGTLWLCHVPRSDVTHRIIRAAAEECGFAIEAYDTKNITVHDCPNHDLERAVVYQVKRCRRSRCHS